MAKSLLEQPTATEQPFLKRLWSEIFVEESEVIAVGKAAGLRGKRDSMAALRAHMVAVQQREWERLKALKGTDGVSFMVPNGEALEALEDAEAPDYVETNALVDHVRLSEGPVEQIVVPNSVATMLREFRPAGETGLQRVIREQHQGVRNYELPPSKGYTPTNAERDDAEEENELASRWG